MFFQRYTCITSPEKWYYKAKKLCTKHNPCSFLVLYKYNLHGLLVLNTKTFQFIPMHFSNLITLHRIGLKPLLNNSHSLIWKGNNGMLSKQKYFAWAFASNMLMVNLVPSENGYFFLNSWSGVHVLPSSTWTWSSIVDVVYM